jgi:hypothetical protein
MNQVISYSLYGAHPRYLVGAIKNAQLANIFFPGFTVRYYVGNSVPTWVRSTLDLFSNVEQIPVDEREDSTARLWRFRAIYDSAVDVVLSRDTDARLSLREAQAHQEFLDSEFDFHIIRDHPTGHRYLISAGMFACKTKGMGFFKRILDDTQLHDTYMQDQEFLSGAIYPNIIENCLVHDDYYSFEAHKKRSIKRKRINTVCHIGAALDENDVFVYTPDREISFNESGHVKYIYDWGTDESLNHR